MARLFDGSSDYLDIADSAALDVGAGDFTIVLVLKSSTVPAIEDRLFSKGNTSGGTGNGVRYEVTRDGSNLTFVVDDNVTKSFCDYGTLTDLSDGNHHMWFFERDSGSTVKIYEDGNNQRTTAVDNTGNIDVPLSLVIGAGRGSSDTITYFWTGEISEFAIIKRVLTGSEKDEIAAMMTPAGKLESRTFYAPLIRELIDVHGLSINNSGSIVASHPPVVYPQPQILQFPVAAPAGLSNLVGDGGLVGYGSQIIGPGGLVG